MKIGRLIAMALIMLTISTLLFGCNSSASFETINTSTLQKLLDSGEKFALVDIREAGDYKRGHIQGAINLPMGQLERNFSQLDPNSRIVLICYTGHTSQAAAQFLLKQKFTKLTSVAGGMDAWKGQTVK